MCYLSLQSVFRVDLQLLSHDIRNHLDLPNYCMREASRTDTSHEAHENVPTSPNCGIVYQSFRASRICLVWPSEFLKGSSWTDVTFSHMCNSLMSAA